MAYTIPDYVDTKEQAVLALASTIADEDKSALGDGSVNRALDVLADTLAGENVDVPQTNAGAILALAQYVGGGGGDASTATVTYTLTGGKSDVYIFGAIGSGTESDRCAYAFFQSDEVSGSFTALLFGGKALLEVTESYVTVVSGDAEADGGTLTITGDCTLTIEPD